jgi:hypothetical protein
MSNELEVFALTNTLAEIKHLCPDVSNAFIFIDDGTLVAMDKNTDTQTATRTAKVIDALSKRAKTIGGLESAAFYSGSNRVNVFRVNEYYLTMVGSEEPDEKTAKALARILIPTVLKLTDRIRDVPKKTKSRTEKLDIYTEIIPDVDDTGTDIEADEIAEGETEPFEEPPEPEPDPDPLLPDPPVTQFMVENLGGLRFASDIVRIDRGVIQQWKDLYEDRVILEVELETLNGGTTRCRFKPLRGSKNEGKGIIQLPQKLQRKLQISKGELIMIKPVIE